ncbi:MAG: hypothetical protein E6I58_09750 [Chloroflexi bacterium]|nr:MAG: hypothetical protein E6J05_10835 [Chloroflexota bacterium]TME55761.1 MAG: hypothetical protein E6I58_09750 [Chloroflexota bacterium]
MKTFVVLGISLAAIALSTAPALAADANGNHEAYVWVVAGDTAIAPDGSTIFIKGRGTLEAGPQGSATGGGTFSINGGPIGTWKATGVEGFVSYGTSLPGSALPPPPATGGMAKLHVSFSNGQVGVLTIFCVIGSPPPSVGEGIHLILGGGSSSEYTDEGRGFTIFIAT